MHVFTNKDNTIAALFFIVCTYVLLAYILPLVYARRVPLRLRHELKLIASQQELFLSFDDGPSEITPYLIELLDSYRQRAFFFVIASKLTKPHYAACVQKAHQQGQLIGIHAYQHKHAFSLIGSYLNMKRAYQRLQELGITPAYIRAPHGFYNAALLYFAARYKLQLIHWDGLLEDWKDLPLRKLIEHAYNSIGYVQRQHKLPCILVLHDGKAGAAKPYAYLSTGLYTSRLLEQGVVHRATKAS